MWNYNLEAMSRRLNEYEQVVSEQCLLSIWKPPRFMFIQYMHMSAHLGVKMATGKLTFLSYF